jgi:hypothetical protein
MFHFQISKICKVMREYQEINNIKEMCMTNSQTLYDIIKSSFPSVDVKAKAVIAVNEMDNFVIKQTIHLMIIADGIYYEPSYELYIVKPTYFSNVKNLLEGFVPNTLIKDNLKYTLPSFLRFVEHEHNINNGDFLITDKDYYNNQLDYIQSKLN